ncbi:YdcF family protein [Pseudothermotoga thermarum]|uniref:DUF218 domain-containing protein n=1 Tax=Pseudothermotoga thermarum DSM 5069 TaxID=688269 RepID=F7YTQ6_9THEM|nr:YdcF family protein [Pseudothermotoga thermarum]AEH51284.1 protein of unknown function DUF218 [Pseudothermotoga thermarum DSM 5069]
MIAIVKVLEAFVLPPGLFVTIMVALGFKVYKLKKSLAMVLFFTGVLFYVLSSAVGILIFVQPLEKEFSWVEPFEPDAVVVFGGGVIKTPSGYQLGPNSVFRMLTGINLATKYQVPLIVSGGYIPGTKKIPEAVVMKDFAKNYMPEQMIVVEPAAQNTRQNAKYTEQIAEKYGFKRLYLVTSAVHLKRSILSFKKTTLEIAPYPANYLYDYSIGWIDLLPNKDALNANLSAIHELVGMIYYKLLEL